jgi:hypothetical protein
MLDDHAIEHRLDRWSIFGWQLSKGFELHLELVIRPIIGVESELIGRGARQYPLRNGRASPYIGAGCAPGCGIFPGDTRS